MSEHERTTSATDTFLPMSSSPGEKSKRALLQRLIEQFAAIHDGWNGAGSVAPRAASVNAARTFLESIPPGVALPTPMITEFGEMEFYWSLPTGYADISFDAEGIGSLFIRSMGSDEFFEEGFDPQFLRFP